MSGVDERIVQMNFDNGAFEKKIGDTLQSLDKLTQSLKFQGAQDGFKNVSAAADSVNLSSMAGALDNISSKFSAMGAVGFSVISNLTTSALGFAKTVADKVLDPLLTGGRQRAINLENAKFAFQGLGIDVSAAMDSALAAVKGTAFGLDDAAKAAAQFGASGIGAGADMTQSLRGIAGIAAMTNRSFGEIADIMTSSAATGKITNMDLEQFATRGLNAAAAYAKATGVTEAQVHQMATAGTIDYASFAKAMDDTFGAHAQAANQTFTGALGNMHAALSRLGAAFYIPQLENQKNLFNALSPAIDNVKTALQPLIDMFSWFSTIKTNRIIDFINALDFTKLQAPMKNFAQAFANIMDAIQAFMVPVKQAFNEIIPINAGDSLLKFSEAVKDFTEKLKIGGKTVGEVREVFYGLFSILDIVWAVIKGVVTVIGDLVKAIAPAGGGVLALAAGLGENLRMLDATLVSGGKIQAFFDGLGAFIQKPIAFLKQLGTAISDMFKSFSGSDVADTALGRVNSRVDETKSSVEKLDGLWQHLLDRFSGVVDVLDKIWEYISHWFGELGSKLAAAFKPGDFDSAVDIVNVGLLGGITLMIKKFIDNGAKLDLSGGFLPALKSMFGQLTTTLKSMQTELKAEALEKIAVALGVLTASLVVLSMIDSAALTKALTAMAVSFGEMVGVMALIDKLIDSNAAAIKLGIIGAALIEFATAAAVLTLAVRNLSGLSWSELAKGLVGVAGGLLIMVAASKLMSDGSLGMIAAGAGMTAISVGLLVLSEAVKSFSTMGWAEMAKGLAGVAGGLILVTAAMQLMPAGSVISGLGFIEISAGLIILAQAVKQFGNMDWGELGKGLLGIGASLLIVAAAMNLMPLDAPITAAGLLILSVALNVMAEAIKVIGDLDMGTLAKGIGGIAAMLLVLAIATNAMDGALPGAAAMVVVAAALTVLTKVLETLGSMKMGDIVQALIALAGVFAVLGIAALVMEPIIPALLGLGAAIALIGGGFALFGAGVWLVAQGLQALAETGVAGAKAFVEMLKTVGSAIPELLMSIFQGIVDEGEQLLKAAPLLLRLITAVLDQLLDTVIQLAPKLGKALVEVMKAALGFIREEFPDYVKTGFEMLMALLQGVKDNIGPIVTTVADIIVNFLDALKKKVPEIVDSAYNLMVTVLTSVAEKLGQAQFLFIPVAEAFITGFITGFQTYMPGIINFFTGLPGNIIGWLGDVGPTLLTKGIDLLTGLLTGIVQKAIELEAWWIGLPGSVLGWIGDVGPTLLTKGVDILTGFLQGIVQKAIELETWWVSLPGVVLGWIGDVGPTMITKGVDIITGFLNGIVQKAIELETWWVSLPGVVIGWLGDVVPTLVSKGVDIIAGFLNGVVEKAIELESWWVGLPGTVIGWLGDVLPTLVSKGIDIIAGFLNGITDKFGDVISWLVDLPGKILSYIPNPLEMLKDAGVKIIQGLIDGIGSMLGSLKDAIGNAVSTITDHLPFSPVKIGPLTKLNNSNPGETIIRMISNGILRSAPLLVDAMGTALAPISSVVDEMTVSMNASFSAMRDSLNGIEEFQPTITPVLDLTKVKMGAKDLNDLFNNRVISPVASFDQARTISTTADLAKSTADAASTTPPSEVTFNQYNNSPDALSTNDIFRNTKSLIALAKEELSI